MWTEKTNYADLEMPGLEERNDLDEILSACVEDPAAFALFLDLDGTMLDLAATPEAVILPETLLADMKALHSRMGGAIALVTGRSLAFVDGLFGMPHLAVAGLHGTEIRLTDGKIHAPPPGDGFHAAFRLTQQRCEALNGALFENKGLAFAVHYRSNPGLALALEALCQEALILAGEDYVLQRGKMVLEIRPGHGDKGKAVQHFLSTAPFHGRVAIALGDDVTDEAMFETVNQLGGISIRVGENKGPSAARLSLAGPACVRHMISRMAHEP